VWEGFDLKRVGGGQIFDFAAVRPRTSGWPGRVLVMDTGCLGAGRPILLARCRLVLCSIDLFYKSGWPI